MRGDSREVLLPAQVDVSERGRKMARRVGIGFIILMAANVGVGLWLIARHETKKSESRIARSANAPATGEISRTAAAMALTPAPLGVSEITIAAAPGRWMRLRTKSRRSLSSLAVPHEGIPEQHRLGLLIDLPANREDGISGGDFDNHRRRSSSASPLPSPNETAAPGAEKKSFAVQIVESPLPQN